MATKSTKVASGVTTTLTNSRPRTTARVAREGERLNLKGRRRGGPLDGHRRGSGGPPDVHGHRALDALQIGAQLSRDMAIQTVAGHVRRLTPQGPAFTVTPQCVVVTKRGLNYCRKTTGQSKVPCNRTPVAVVASLSPFLVLPTSPTAQIGRSAGLSRVSTCVDPVLLTAGTGALTQDTLYAKPMMGSWTPLAGTPATTIPSPHSRASAAVSEAQIQDLNPVVTAGRGCVNCSTPDTNARSRVRRPCAGSAPMARPAT